MSKYYNVALQAFLRIIACITVCVQVKKFAMLPYIILSVNCVHRIYCRLHRARLSCPHWLIRRATARRATAALHR